MRDLPAANTVEAVEAPLRGKHEGLHSVSINLSCRITLELLIQDQQIIPVNVGDHDAGYRMLR